MPASSHTLGPFLIDHGPPPPFFARPPKAGAASPTPPISKLGGPRPASGCGPHDLSSPPSNRPGARLASQAPTSPPLARRGTFLQLAPEARSAVSSGKRQKSGLVKSHPPAEIGQTVEPVRHALPWPSPFGRAQFEVGRSRNRAGFCCCRRPPSQMSPKQKDQISSSMLRDRVSCFGVFSEAGAPSRRLRGWTPFPKAMRVKLAFPGARRPAIASRVQVRHQANFVGSRARRRRRVGGLGPPHLSIRRSNFRPGKKPSGARQVNQSPRVPSNTPPRRPPPPATDRLMRDMLEKAAPKNPAPLECFFVR